MAIAYYIVPVIIRSPLYSHLLSLIGFWSIAFFYGLVGQHHILQTPTPGWLKTLAVLGSFGLFIPVFTFLTNIWLTMRGNWGKIYESLPLKFMIVGHDLLLHHLRAGAVPVHPGLQPADPLHQLDRGPRPPGAAGHLLVLGHGRHLLHYSGHAAAAHL